MRLLVVVLGVAVAQNKCPKAEPESELLPGMTFAFTAPIARIPLLPKGSPELVAVQEEIEWMYERFNSETECPAEPIQGYPTAQTNDEFYIQQMISFDAGEDIEFSE